MSTKSTIAYGDNFHFYHEALDDDHVYLELERTEFESEPGRVMVQIPVEIWEVIRHNGAPDLSLADMDDAAIRKMVEDYVQSRLKDYEEAKAKNSNSANILALCGAMRFGFATEPVEDQVAEGIKNMTEERARQKAIKDKIQALTKSKS